jgi:hypothetical protein
VISYWQLCASYVHGHYGRTDRRASFAEYALVVAFIAIVCVAALAFAQRGGAVRLTPTGWSI